VDRGEILGLVGPNGAGKTTTLRCLSGIVPPTSGSVRICGHDLLADPITAKQRLAFVPDEPHLFDYLTVWDYLRVLGRIYNVPDTLERAADLLDQFGLAERRRAFPAELSRGMKQKLLIAGALLHRPEVLVLDEPLTGLDPRAMRQTKDVLRQGARDGMAVLVSSHMLHLVEEISDRVALIHRGRKVLDGTLDEIRGRLPHLGEGAALEEIFLHATGEDAP
jgi:ABC-2 type transport system ATP-binding protein